MLSMDATCMWRRRLPFLHGGDGLLSGAKRCFRGAIRVNRMQRVKRANFAISGAQGLDIDTARAARWRHIYVVFVGKNDGVLRWL